MLVVISSLVYLFGLGRLAAWPLRRIGLAQHPARKRLGGATTRGAADLASWLLLGILCNFSLVLILRSLRSALVAGAVLSGAGLIAAAGSSIRRRRLPRSRGDGAAAEPIRLPEALGVVSFWVAFGSSAFVLAIAILGTPIREWDARSIWFLHAKMIYYAGVLGPEAGFAVVPFSHPDYPKLFATLAAQLAHASGYWNEYLPKGALLMLILPALLATFSLLRAPLAFAFLFSMSWLRVGPKLSDGTLDGPLALFGALGALSLVRWIADRDPRDGVLGALCLATCCALKNEGFVLAACLSAPLLIPWWGRRSALACPLGAWRTAYLAVIALAPFAGWEILKRMWGFHADYAVSGAFLGQIASRVVEQDGLAQIAAAFGKHGLHHAAIPFLVALGLALATGTRIGFGAWALAGGALLYSTVLALVYLGSPFDLDWQLRSSAGRTLLAPILAAYAATYCVIAAIEAASGVEPSSGGGRELNEAS